MADPAKLLSFHETSVFRADWRALGLSLDDLFDLQTELLRQPDVGKVIGTTGGLRKPRFRQQATNRGKRGSYRVCFAYYQQSGIIPLALVNAKNEKVDLSAKDRAAVAQLVERFGKGLKG